MRYIKPLSLQGRSHRFKSCSAHKGFSLILINLSYKILILVVMKSLETKILNGLMFITIFSFSYYLIFATFISFFAPQETLNDFKFFGFIITFFGIHAFFALCTFVSTRLPANGNFSLITLGASIVMPTTYLIFNINYLSSLNISTFIIFLYCAIIIDFIRGNAERYILRKYIRVLINPFHLDDEIF